MNLVLTTGLFYRAAPRHQPAQRRHWITGCSCGAAHMLGWKARKPKSALFVCYEDLCTREENWTRLAALADISVEHNAGDSFKLSNRPVEAPVDQGLADEANAIYLRLVTLART